MMSRTGIVQDKFVKHLKEKTGRYYDLFDLARFPSARSWEISGFPTGLFQRGSYGIGWSLLVTDPGGLSSIAFWHQYTKQHVWHRYATDGILHCGQRSIGPTKGAFFCTWLMEDLVSGGNHMSPMPPATSRKPFQLAGVLWWCGRAFRVISSRIWSHFEAILLSQDVRRTSWKPLSTITLITTRPVCMDDNLRPHRMRALMDVLQWNAITTIPRDSKVYTHTHTHTHTLSYRQDCTFHGLYYSRGALAGTRNRSMSPSWGIDPTIHRTMKHRIIMTRFRLGNHRLPTEIGRLLSIPTEKRLPYS